MSRARFKDPERPASWPVEPGGAGRSSTPTVFLVSREPGSFAGVEHLLKARHLKVCKCASVRAFFAHQPTEKSGVVVAEARRPELVGLKLLQRLVEREIDLPVIIVADNGEVPLAVQSIRAGALEFLEEPVSPTDLVQRIGRSLDRYRRSSPGNLSRLR